MRSLRVLARGQESLRPHCLHVINVCESACCARSCSNGKALAIRTRDGFLSLTSLLRSATWSMPIWLASGARSLPPKGRGVCSSA